MKKLLNFKNSIIMIIGSLLCLSGLIGCSSTSVSNGVGQALNIIEQVTDSSNKNNIVLNNPTENSNESNIDINNIPAYSGNDYIVLNNNIPNFSDSDLTTTSFEEYSPLDSLGRCGVAYANIGTDLMPTEERESISSVKPSGWQSIKYDIVEGKYLYNRSHLIGFQLTAENANKSNLITGTRYFNANLMLPYENMVADYIKETNNHVLYRVTPVFEGNNLVATGVQMEAKSVEDNGEGIEFNVFVYNVQPGITIDYATGASALASEEIHSEKSSNNSSNKKTIIRGNSKSKIYHCPGQRDYENMSDSVYLINFNSEEEAIAAGYRKASR
ncbi:DNA/RNA non-specific endonuclease [uncultured Clostridium sp.]|uniref:DNA/RNA non-specific endonuclease n=1 Tax=uncultured Clostridium sp. TaxID=59620 RepID=UPI0026738422|nr:DNA/RNA non-specific endonuclease [uncultured Clostridium sp.]